ncbi:nascent polypeptide-associated complex subunit alpha, muscle-specific form-like isoform X2 [Dromiciops gliroides]|uniref:nascent polypeptide-associated complex subunit alpha, muscle-specific form-like isoform X2 n=1 Tax=Dromiciops gliroides TaxID=33562 RepID=UPI001CC33F14|nr:nascent polypeptide-associated complex subunit alpha, muscle-specific form-like isoform X2 [Dromiciops gliroides]
MSPNNTLGYRASFAEEAQVIAEQLQGQGGEDVSTIEAEIPPLDLTSSASFVDPPASDQAQGQPGDSPLPAPTPDPGQEPPAATPSEQGLLFLEGLPPVEGSISPAETDVDASADSVAWPLNVTMELCGPAPDAAAGGEGALPPVPDHLLSPDTPPIPAQRLDNRAGGEGALPPVHNRSHLAIMTSTPQGALGGLRLSEEASAFSFPESPPAQEAPTMAGAEQPIARRLLGPLAAIGSPPKAPKSGPLGKLVQEKRSLGGASSAVSRRGHQVLPLTGQKRWSAVPSRASGMPVLLKSRREPMAPPGPRQQKSRNSEAGGMKEAEPPAKAGNNPPSTAKMSQLLHSKSVPPQFSLHQRGPSARDPKTSRDPQAARTLKPIAPNQGTRSRAPSKADEQPSRQDRRHQASSGQTCPQVREVWPPSQWVPLWRPRFFLVAALMKEVGNHAAPTPHHSCIGDLSFLQDGVWYKMQPGWHNQWTHDPGRGHLPKLSFLHL